MNNIKFEVGRFYKRRDGAKCICLATNAEGSQPNLMTETNEDGTILPRTFSVCDDGRFWTEMMRGKSSRDRPRAE